MYILAHPPPNKIVQASSVQSSDSSFFGILTGIMQDTTAQRIHVNAAPMAIPAPAPTVQVPSSHSQFLNNASVIPTNTELVAKA
mmetsp:Transcript_13006/g.28128  ORF Transcript_13006/g.28128 Transcript_13006/m.28128 type:complete len:84 (+) Transcript_13006:1462-1713(+)